MLEAKSKPVRAARGNFLRSSFSRKKQSMLALLFSAVALSTVVGAQQQSQFNGDADLGKIVPDASDPNN